MPPHRRSRAARLDAVAARLTVSQRLAALLADPESPAVHHIIRQGLTPAERATLRSACDRVVYLRITSHACLLRVEGAIPILQWAGLWLSTVRETATTADQLEAALASSHRRRAAKGTADPELVADGRVIAERLRAAAVGADTAGAGDPPRPTMDALLRDGILAVHQLLRALAIEAEAFAAALGADPLTPELQALADRQRAALTACIETVDLDPPVALTEPSDAYLAAIAACCRPEEEAVTW